MNLTESVVDSGCRVRPDRHPAGPLYFYFYVDYPGNRCIFLFMESVLKKYKSGCYKINKVIA